MFSFSLTVVPSHSDVIIFWQSLFHVFQLMNETLLCSKNVEVVILHYSRYHGIAQSPSITITESLWFAFLKL